MLGPPVFGRTFHGGMMYRTVSNKGFLSGTLFELARRTRTLNTLHMFTDGDDGALPLAGVAYLKGRLNGTSFTSSFAQSAGTVFQYDLAQHQLTTLRGFSEENPDE
jgi:hypothetical protein